MNPRRLLSVFTRWLITSAVLFHGCDYCPAQISGHDPILSVPLSALDPGTNGQSVYIGYFFNPDGTPITGGSNSPATLAAITNTVVALTQDATNASAYYTLTIRRVGGGATTLLTESNVVSSFVGNGALLTNFSRALQFAATNAAANGFALRATNGGFYWAP